MFLRVLGVFLARGVAGLGGVVFSVIVARTSGASGLGQITVFTSFLYVVTILSRRGQDMLLARAVAWARVQGSEGSPFAFMLFSLRRILPTSFLGAFLGAAMLASGFWGPVIPGSAFAFFVALPLMTILTLLSGYSKGMGRASLAALFQGGGAMIIASGLLIIASLLLDSEVRAGIPWIITLAIAITTGIAIVFITIMDGQFPKHNFQLEAKQNLEMTKGELDFVVIATTTFLVQAGSFILAAPFLSPEDLGLVRAAERLALIVGFPGLVISSIIAPQIVQLSRSGRLIDLYSTIRRAMITIGGIGGLALLPLMIMPEQALAMMGPEFAPAAPYLQLMVLAQFVVAVFGPMAVFLNMSGHERTSMWINIASLAVGVALVPYLSIHYNALGFTIAYFISVFVRVFLIFILYRILVKRMER